MKIKAEATEKENSFSYAIFKWTSCAPVMVLRDNVQRQNSRLIKNKARSKMKHHNSKYTYVTFI